MKTSINAVFALVTINVGIATYFVYFHWDLKGEVTRVKYGTDTQRTI